MVGQWGGPEWAPTTCRTRSAATARRRSHIGLSPANGVSYAVQYRIDSHAAKADRDVALVQQRRGRLRPRNFNARVLARHGVRFEEVGQGRYRRWIGTRLFSEAAAGRAIPGFERPSVYENDGGPWVVHYGPIAISTNITVSLDKLTRFIE
jgi:hypothetical protein